MLSGDVWKPSRFYPQLDGLRAAAVTLVLLVHMDDVKMPGPLRFMQQIGWTGVDVFFVLSGFLITGILLSRKPSPKTLGVFVLRRTLRTWPLYFLILLSAFFSLRHSDTGAHINWMQHVFFLQNYTAVFVAKSLKPTWSLCVEEHFYLLWPFVVFLLPRRALPWLIAVLIAALPGLRWMGLHSGFTIKQLYTETQFHLDGLMAGSLIAVVLTRWQFRRRMLIGVGVLAMVAGAVASKIGFWGNWNVGTGNNIIFGFTTVALTAGGVMMLLLSDSNSLLSRALAFAPVQYIGRISYGIYLLHDGFLSVYVKHKKSLPGWVQQYWFIDIALRFALIILIAAISYACFESPILRLKDRLRYSGPADDTMAREPEPASEPAATAK